jgi:diguanylate cyclase (GGDEF)-like protein/PAS domain S-box-containing protein
MKGLPMSYSAAFYRALVDQMNDGVYFVDRRRRITYWSRGAERLTGYSAAEVMGQSCKDALLNHVTESGVELCGSGCPLKATMQDGRCRDAHVFMHHANGHRQPVWVRAAPLNSNGKIVGAIEVFSDDSAVAGMQAQMNELTQQALTDTLTGLGNRRYLERQLDARVNEWQRYETPFGLLMADVDLFKQVNDIHGHDIGDQVLAMVARTLAFGLRTSEVAARYGGEEFVVLVPQTTPDGLTQVADRLRMLVETSRLPVARDSISVTVSIGATLVTPSDNADTVLRRADNALYTAKNEGRNRVHIAGPHTAGQ